MGAAVQAQADELVAAQAIGSITEKCDFSHSMHWMWTILDIRLNL